MLFFWGFVTLIVLEMCFLLKIKGHVVGVVFVVIIFIKSSKKGVSVGLGSEKSEIRISEAGSLVGSNLGHHLLEDKEFLGEEAAKGGLGVAIFGDSCVSITKEGKKKATGLKTLEKSTINQKETRKVSSKVYLFFLIVVDALEGFLSCKSINSSNKSDLGFFYFMEELGKTTKVWVLEILELGGWVYIYGSAMILSGCNLWFLCFLFFSMDTGGGVFEWGKAVFHSLVFFYIIMSLIFFGSSLLVSSPLMKVINFLFSLCVEETSNLSFLMSSVRLKEKGMGFVLC